MRELCIACKRVNTYMLEDLNKYISADHHQIVTNFADNEYSYLLFADVTNFNCVYKLKNAFLNYFVNEFKYDFLLGKIGKRDDFLFLACVKVLALFDRETDEQFLLGDMALSGWIYLDSYVDFRLNILKKRWQEIADLAIDNNFALLDYATMGRIMSFLISTMPQNAHIGRIAKNEMYLFIHDGVEESFDLNDKLGVVTNLLRINPACIVYDENIDDDMKAFLDLCFAEKIKNIQNIVDKNHLTL